MVDWFYETHCGLVSLWFNFVGLSWLYLEEGDHMCVSS